MLTSKAIVKPPNGWKSEPEPLQYHQRTQAINIMLINIMLAGTALEGFRGITVSLHPHNVSHHLDHNP